jgi:hypothetical protein
MSKLSDAIAAAGDLLARGEALAADIAKFDVEAIINDAKAAGKALEADLPALKAEAESVMAGVNAKLSAVGQALHAVGLSSAGPNVQNSIEGNGEGTGSGVA